MPITLTRQQRAVERWNADNPPGTSIIARRGAGIHTVTATASKAWLFAGRTPVVHTMSAGRLELDRVTPAKKDA